MRTFFAALLLLPVIIGVGTTHAQMTVSLVAEPNPAVDSDILIHNSFFERPNNKSGWLYDPLSTVSGPYRDLGQSFKPSQAFFLDKVIVAISPGTTAANFEASNGAPVHLDIYRFNSVDNMEPPVDTLSSQGGHLPTGMVYSSTETRYLQFDMVDVPLSPGNFYAFLMKYDSLKANRRLEIVKSEDADRYPNGRMLYTEFNGDDGRTNITVYKWKHGGGNLNRDIHFWLKRASTSGIAVEQEAMPQAVSLSANYPNPFNATTMIRYQLPQAGNASVKIYDLSGNMVDELVDGYQQEGAYSLVWDGCDRADRPLPSGLYYLQLRFGALQQIQKMTLLR